MDALSADALQALLAAAVSAGTQRIRCSDSSRGSRSSRGSIQLTERLFAQNLLRQQSQLLHECEFGYVCCLQSRLRGSSDINVAEHECEEIEQQLKRILQRLGQLLLRSFLGD